MRSKNVFTYVLYLYLIMNENIPNNANKVFKHTSTYIIFRRYIYGNLRDKFVDQKTSERH